MDESVIIPPVVESEPPPPLPRPVDILDDPSERLRPSTYVCLLYHFYTGELMGNFDVPSTGIDDWIQYHSTNYLMTSGYPESQYVDVVNKVLIDRPENPAVLDGMFIRNVPSPHIPEAMSEGPIEGVQTKTRIFVNHDGSAKWDCHETEDDEIELDFPPGRYKIDIRAFPYKDKVIEVVV